MFHALTIAPGGDIAASRASGWSKPADKTQPLAAPPSPRRFCPICGHDTHQRLVECGRDYLTFWCPECVIPHDVERTSVDMAGGRMDVRDLIQPQSVLTGMRVGTKKEALALLARQAAASTGQPARTILDALIERERLGSTGVGGGIAIPHARLPGLGGLCAAFLRLDRSIDFEAVDERPVDLIFLLLSPEAAGGDHLRALSRVSRLLRDGDVCRTLRRATEAGELYSFLIGQFRPV